MGYEFTNSLWVTVGVEVRWVRGGEVLGRVQAKKRLVFTS